MPIEYTIFSEGHLVIERFRGRVTVADVHHVTQQIWSDEAYQKSFDGIIDLTDATFDMSPKDMIAISEFLLASPEASHGRVAMIVSKPFETALSFLFQSNTAMKNEVAVFSTWASVRDFLQLSDSLTRQLAGRL